MVSATSMTRVRPIVLIPPRYCPYKSPSIAGGEERRREESEGASERASKSEKERETEKVYEEWVRGGGASGRGEIVDPI